MKKRVLLDLKKPTFGAQSQLCEWAVRAQSCRAIRASCSWWGGWVGVESKREGQLAWAHGHCLMCSGVGVKRWSCVSLILKFHPFSSYSLNTCFVQAKNSRSCVFSSEHDRPISPSSPRELSQDPSGGHGLGSRQRE